MSIDFGNPLVNQGALLARLRAMFARAESPADPGTGAEGVTNDRRTDRFGLSSDAKRLVDELRQDRPGSNYDAERVAALRQSIESGTFRIDSHRIADRISLDHISR